MKNMFGSATKLIRIALLFFFACASSTARAQDIIYDWASKELKQYPSKINRPTTVNIIIKNVNDVLYEYKISVTAIPQAIDDWANLSGILTRAARSAAITMASRSARSADECSTALDEGWALLRALDDTIKKDPALPIKILENGPPYPSVP
jgi:hypothetical protein